jgi:hypothetical protein
LNRLETEALLPGPTRQPPRTPPLPHMSPTAARLHRSRAAAGCRLCSPPLHGALDCTPLPSPFPPPRQGSRWHHSSPPILLASSPPPKCTEYLHHPLLPPLNSSRHKWPPHIAGFQPKRRRHPPPTVNFTVPPLSDPDCPSHFSPSTSVMQDPLLDHLRPSPEPANDEHRRPNRVPSPCR